MAERELKKMNRSELIEIIYAQQKEEHELRDKIKQLEEKLTERVARFNKDDFVVLLDENGEMMSSPRLSQSLKVQLENGRDVIIVIGGAFGHFAPEVKARANLIWSLSKLVFPHQICRLIVTEQIYRAQEIYLGHAYHHE